MARAIPPVNATLTKVSRVERVPSGGGGYTDTLVTTWEGNVPAFSTERNSIEAGGSGPINVYTANLIVPSTVPVDVGDTLDYTRNGETQQRRVDSTEDRSDFGYTRTFVSEPE